MPPLTAEKTKTKDTTPSNNSALDKEIELLRTENQQLKAAAATSGRLAAALGRADENAAQRLKKEKDAVKLDKETMEREKAKLAKEKELFEKRAREAETKKKEEMEKALAVAKKSADGNQGPTIARRSSWWRRSGQHWR